MGRFAGHKAHRQVNAGELPRSRFPEVLDVLFHDLFQRGWLRQAESDGAGAIDGDGPVIHDALDPGVERIHNRTKFQAALVGDLLEDGLCELRRDAMRRQAIARSSLKRSAGTSCNAISESITVR